jgi:hypothetical protein
LQIVLVEAELDDRNADAGGRDREVRCLGL